MRLLITGAAGSGTTTLGKAIVAKNGWNFFDADEYYWLPTNPPYQEKRDQHKRLEMILNDLHNCTHAVVSGSIMDWGLELEDAFNVIVFLYLDTNIRVERVKRRELDLFGSVDPKFIQWVSEYDTGPSEGRSLAKHNDWLSHRDCEVITIKGDVTLDKKIEIVSDQIN